MLVGRPRRWCYLTGSSLLKPLGFLSRSVYSLEFMGVSDVWIRCSSFVEGRDLEKELGG